MSTPANDADAARSTRKRVGDVYPMPETCGIGIEPRGAANADLDIRMLIGMMADIPCQ